MRIALIALVLLTLCACSPSSNKLPLTGDVPAGLGMRPNVTLDETLHNLNIDAQAALLVSHDGTAIRMARDGFDTLSLTREGDQWNAIDIRKPSMPVLQNLREICLQCANPAYTVDVLHGAEKADTFSPYAMRLRQYERLGDDTPFATAYKARGQQALWSGPATAITTSEHVLAVSADTLNFTGNYLLCGPDTLAMLWFLPPTPLRQVRDQLANSAGRQSVLLCVVEGLSWDVWQHFTEGDSTLAPDVLPAAWLQEDDKRLLANLPAGALAVTAAPITVATGVERIMVRDAAGDGCLDDDVFAAASVRMREADHSMAVHFPSLAAVQAATGAASDESYMQAYTTLQYIAALTAKWPGDAYMLGVPSPMGPGAGHRRIAVWGKL